MQAGWGGVSFDTWYRKVVQPDSEPQPAPTFYLILNSNSAYCTANMTVVLKGNYTEQNVMTRKGGVRNRKEVVETMGLKLRCLIDTFTQTDLQCYEPNISSITSNH